MNKPVELDLATKLRLKAHARELVENASWLDLIRLIESFAIEDIVKLGLAFHVYKAFAALSDDVRAEKWLDLALANSPENATLHRAKGVMHQKRREWSQAVERFRASVALRPDNAVFRGCLGVGLFHAGDYAGAAQELRTALDSDPTRRAWLIRLARSLVHMNELSDAVTAYRQALQIQYDVPTRSAMDELLRQIRTGSRAASSAYYDAVYADSHKYDQVGTNSDYATMWQRVAQLLRECGATSILDLGCGPGQFAEFVAAHLPGMAYTGLDFSGVAITKARKRCPQFLFEKRTLPTGDFANLPAFDVVVCTEVLEHMEPDRELLAALPAGTRVIASVPDFDAFGHLRVFRTEDEVRARYGELLNPLSVHHVPLSAQNALWLLEGARTTAALALEPLVITSGSGDVAAHAVDAVLWADGTRYVEDFLPMFGLPFATVGESGTLTEPHVALRHDVDWSIEHAYVMATLEHQLGVRSTYFLLHPDGDITRRNYFGHVDGDQLVIDSKVFDWASRLLDLGHEVALHNDLISLSLATRRQPREFLEQIVEAFIRRGIPLAGSVAHGSRTCRELGYMNYQIFEDLQQMHVAVDYRDSPLLFERFAEPVVERDGHVVRKFALRMGDYGLRYEANFVPWEVYVSDSSARWSMWHGQEMTRFDKFESPQRVREALAELLARKQARTAVQCLVHACHWGPLAHLHARALQVVRGWRNKQFAVRRRSSMLQRLAAFDNVLLARASDRFDVYDQAYGARRQLYKVTSTVGRFMQAVVRDHALQADAVLEVGCGQGDFLAGVHAQLQALRPDRAVYALGVDGSLAAIVTCAGRYPALHWAADELEHYLDVHDEHVRDGQGRPRRFDMVLDKTGAIFIASHAEACRYFEQLERLMRPGAIYVYVASRHYYEKILREKNYAGWPEDWLTIAARVFQPLAADDDDAPALRGYIKRVFQRRPAVDGLTDTDERIKEVA